MHLKKQSKPKKRADGSKESGRWKPANWKPATLSNHLRGIQKAFVQGCEDIVGPHNGRILAAEFKARLDETKSAAMLKALGVKTLGDRREE